MILFTSPKREINFVRADEEIQVENPEVIQHSTPTPETPTVAPIIADNSTPIREMIDFYAEMFNVSKEMAHYIVKCESNYNEKNVGDSGRSFGLWQWFLPAHPEMPKECALDSTCSTIAAMKDLRAGKVRQWTCGKYYLEETNHL